MIAVIETLQGGLAHEMFNAGILHQLHKVYPREKILFFSEKEHGEYVKKVLDTHSCSRYVQFINIARIYLNYNREDIQSNKEEYINIFRKCSRAKFVMILSLEAVNSGLLKNIMHKFPNLNFGVCIHGNIEDILPQNSVKFVMNYNLIWALRECRRKKLAQRYFKQNLEEMASLPNCNIILYSDNYKNYKNSISLGLYENIKVLNLSYVFTYSKEPPLPSEKFRIGIMPLTSTAKAQNGIKVINYVNSQNDRIQYPYIFRIFNYDIGYYKNVEYIRSGDRSRRDVENFLEMCDWILIPYDKNKYRLSSSGVMFDAIEAERPFFVLDSPSFFKAVEAGCGIQAVSIKELGELIIEKINSKNSDYRQYYKNIKSYKKRVEKENLERLITIFGDCEIDI